MSKLIGRDARLQRRGRARFGFGLVQGELKQVEAALAARQAEEAAGVRAEHEEELRLALAALHRKIAVQKKAEVAANRRAAAESAAADVLRAGIAAEEALDKQSEETREAVQRAAQLGRSRPRGLPLIAAALAAAVAVLATSVFMSAQQSVPQASLQPAGEPLKLKLEFALPAARR